MVKTLASIAVIVVAIIMAWGLKYVGERNKAAVAISNDQIPMTKQIQNSNDQVKNNEQIDLEIISPEEGAVINKASVNLEGWTVSGAEVMVNDKELIADEDGNFSTKLTLDEGENEIVVVVNDEVGDYAEKIVKVVYEPAE